MEDIQINRQTYPGDTPLLLASSNGHYDMAKKLIEAGCDVNLANVKQQTPLHVGIRHPNITQLLIESGAHLDALDYCNETPLFETILENCLETFCMLLCYNADPNVYSENGITPFMKAIISENTDMQEFLLEYVTDFHARTANFFIAEGMTVLNLAITHECPLVEEIIRRGANVNYPVHPDLNTFSLCLRVPNLNKFRVIWKDFKYQKMTMSLIRFIVEILDDAYVYDYIQIIFESGNIDPLFEDFELLPYLEFVKSQPNPMVYFEMTLDIIYLYLCYGHILLNSEVSCVYDLYGHRTDVMRICLHMDIRYMYDVDTTKTLARVLYDTDLKISQFKKYFIPLVLEYDVDSAKRFEPYFRINRDWIKYPYRLDPEKQFLCGVPSLLELSRNKTRDYIIKKFRFYSSHTTIYGCKLYFLYLNCLNIPKICKDILSFQQPVYCS
ncbi:uncharacterized protein LOC115879608 isoform X1 [Sitophilus oryzae]|uniref:Uncharacterized protein LOC115879608 isoform X1 n=1 Tax=Sitophilus oryzae TaxID=7048 RepID=A0A6J2XLG1_SITOR|nr:uncharacterized protein LOC115879608 isoform X1 [Sitophilus oryzae]